MTRLVTAMAALALLAAGCDENRSSLDHHDQHHHDTNGKNWSGDAAFVRDAAMANMTEVELGRLAQQRAADPQVRQYGERMIADHSKAQGDLQQVASRHGLEVPRQLDAKHREMVDKHRDESGREFDRSYLDMMVNDHQKVIDKFEAAANNAENEDIRRFAAETLPTLREHLRLARDLKSSDRASR